MIAEFSDRIAQIVTDYERNFPGTAGFGDAIQRARNTDDGITPIYTFTFNKNVTPQTMGPDPASGFINLLAETEGWLGFIKHSVTYRIAQFVDDVVTGLNGARPYRVVAAARGLLELSAFLHHHTKIVTNAANELSKKPLDDFPGAVVGVIATLNAASHFAQVTRFNWNALVRGDLDEFFAAWDKVDDRVKAKTILDFVDKLPGEEKKAARFFYDMLCDYVHPNVAAHTLVVDRATSKGNDKVEWELSREASSDEAIYVLMHAVAIPVRHSILILLNDLDRICQVKQYFSEWRKKCESYKP